LIRCSPFPFGANVWSCCGGLPPNEYLGQKLTLWFGDPHDKHLLVEHPFVKIFIECHGAAGKPIDYAPPRDLPCLVVPDWPELPPAVLSAASEIDGR
jgi:hypothetical protein